MLLLPSCRGVYLCKMFLLLHPIIVKGLATVAKTFCTHWMNRDNQCSQTEGGKMIREKLSRALFWSYNEDPRKATKHICNDFNICAAQNGKSCLLSCYYSFHIGYIVFFFIIIIISHVWKTNWNINTVDNHCRTQPSPSLSLVVEVQAARDLDVHNQEVFKLMSCGWTRMELFDQYNQVSQLKRYVDIKSILVRICISDAQCGILGVFTL